MEELKDIEFETNSPKIYAIIAAFVALVGLLDSVYLTIKHFTDEPVPCSMIEGCEKVLTSSHAEMFGIPLALFGAAAYFLAFSLAILVFFGSRKLWFIFGILSGLMFLYTLYLLYLQAFVLEAFCQFCLLSALSTTILFILAIISRFLRFR